MEEESNTPKPIKKEVKRSREGLDLEENILQKISDLWDALHNQQQLLSQMNDKLTMMHRTVTIIDKEVFGDKEN